MGFTLANRPAVAHFSPLLLMTVAYLVPLFALRPGAGPIRTPWWSLFVIAALGATIQGGLIFSGLRELPAATATLVIGSRCPSRCCGPGSSAATARIGATDGRHRRGPRRRVALVVGSPSAAGARLLALVILGSLSWSAGQALIQLWAGPS